MKFLALIKSQIEDTRLTYHKFEARSVGAANKKVAEIIKYDHLIKFVDSVEIIHIHNQWDFDLTSMKETEEKRRANISHEKKVAQFNKLKAELGC